MVYIIAGMRAIPHSNNGGLLRLCFTKELLSPRISVMKFFCEPKLRVVFIMSLNVMAELVHLEFGLRRLLVKVSEES